MAYSARNIIIGAAALFISASDSTQTNYTAPEIPAVPAGASNTFATALEASAAWRNVGFTSEGLELAYEPDWGDVEVDQLLDSARIFKTSMRVTLNTTLVEATLENLLVAWGQQGTPTSTTSDSTVGIAGGALGDEPVERSIAAVGPAPRSASNQKRERLYHGRRALSVESVTISARRSEASMFPVSFRLLPDATFPGQEYGVIRDRVVS
jgi:hypothetical protein